jgi:hypothetical protein
MGVGWGRQLHFMTNLWQKKNHPVDESFEILITSVFTTFISTPLYLRVSISVKIMLDITVCSPTPATSLPANFPALIICPVSKSRDASTAVFLSQSLYQWNRIKKLSYNFNELYKGPRKSVKKLVNHLGINTEGKQR